MIRQDMCGAVAVQMTGRPTTGAEAGIAISKIAVAGATMPTGICVVGAAQMTNPVTFAGDEAAMTNPAISAGAVVAMTNPATFVADEVAMTDRTTCAADVVATTDRVTIAVGAGGFATMTTGSTIAAARTFRAMAVVADKVAAGAVEETWTIWWTASTTAILPPTPLARVADVDAVGAADVAGISIPVATEPAGSRVAPV